MKIKDKIVRWSDKLKGKIFLYGSIFDGWSGKGGVPDPGAGEDHPIASVLMRVLNWLLSIFGILAVISFIVAGILYLTAQGEYRNIERAKKAVTAGVVGLVIGLLGYAIVLTIDDLLKG